MINLPLIYLKKSKEVRARCKWEPPPCGWFKLNFDRAARGNLGAAGIGCIINDDTGKWVAQKAMSIPPTSNNLAELEALDKGLQLCIDLGLSRVIIEGDSQIILNAVRKRVTPNWVVNSKLSEVLMLLDRIEDIQIRHIFQEGNQKADWLANKGADGVNFQVFNNI